MEFSPFFQVSWFKRHDRSLNVLTIGRETFSADDRYSLSHRRPDNWRLKVRPTLARDNGTYVCQVSRHPPIILLTHLKIIGEFLTFKIPNFSSGPLFHFCRKNN